jgi:excisionase family DNA binding protein
MGSLFTGTTRPKLMSPAEVAAMLGVHRNTVYAKIHSGELPAVRLGDDGPLRVDAGELEAWLRSHATSQGDEAA